MNPATVENASKSTIEVARSMFMRKTMYFQQDISALPGSDWILQRTSGDGTSGYPFARIDVGVLIMNNVKAFQSFPARPPSDEEYDNSVIIGRASDSDGH